MINPQAYILEGNPFQGLTQGIGQGLQLGAAYADKERAIATAEKEELAKQAMAKDLSDLAKNPSAEMYSQTITKYPQLSEQLKRGYDIMDDGAKKSAVNTATQTSLLLNSGNIGGAKDLLKKQALAFENSGDINQANAYRAMTQMIDVNPEQAKLSTYLIAAQGLDPSQFGEYNAKFGNERREDQLQPYEVAQAGVNINKTNAEIGQTQAQTGLTRQQIQTEQQNTAIKQAEANAAPEYYNLRNQETVAAIDKIKSDQRLGMLNYELESDKLDADLEWRYEELERKGTALGDAGQKLVNDAVTESVTLANLAQQQSSLAKKAAASGQAGGAMTKGWEGVKNAMGISTTRSDMVKEVTRLINSEVIKGLPPGPATDKDIEIIKAGFPKETADGATISRFMQAMSNVNMAAAANKQMQAEWLSQNGSLGSSKRDLDVMGVKVPKGSTYQDFSSKNMGNSIKQLEKMNSQQEIDKGTASYLKYGQ